MGRTGAKGTQMEEDIVRGLGIFAWFGYELPLAESLRRIRAAGFTHALLWWGAFDGDMPLLDQPDLVRRLGLEVENAHAPFDGCNDLWVPGEAGEAYARGLIRSLEECAAAGVPVLVAHITDGPNPTPYSPLGVERLRRVAEAAQRTGVTLALENLRRPLYTTDALDALADCPAVGFCYDSGHDRLCPGSRPLPGVYADRLAALHLHDNDGSGDQHRLPFDGGTDWKERMAAVAAGGYAGPVSLEVQAYGGYEQRMDADAFLSRAHAAAEKLRSYMDEQGAGRAG